MFASACPLLNSHDILEVNRAAERKAPDCPQCGSKWCCAKQGEVPTRTNPFGVAAVIPPATVLAPVDLRLKLRN